MRPAHESFGSPSQETGPAEGQPERGGNVREVCEVFTKRFHLLHSSGSEKRFAWINLENLHIVFDMLKD